MSIEKTVECRHCRISYSDEGTCDAGVCLLDHNNEDIRRITRHVTAKGIGLNTLTGEELQDIAGEYDVPAWAIALVQMHLCSKVEGEWDNEECGRAPEAWIRDMRFYDEEQYGYSAVASDIPGLLSLLEE